MCAYTAALAAGCSFIVAGRVGEAAAAGEKEKVGLGEERFLTLDDVDIPETLRDLFEPMPDFRLDVSSTELRKAAAAAAAAAAE